MTDPSLKSAVELLLSGEKIGRGCIVDGAPVVFFPFVLAHLFHRAGQPLLVAPASPEDALAIYGALLGLGLDVLYLPAVERDPDVPAGFLSPLESYRYAALARLARNNLPAILLLDKSYLTGGIAGVGPQDAGVLTVTPGRMEYSAMRRWLEENGYENVALVTEPGHYAVRGEIIDVFPLNAEIPVRCDFLEDTLESCREFDVHTQLSNERRAAVDILSLHLPEDRPQAVADLFPEGCLIITRDALGRWEIGLADTPRPVVVDLGVAALHHQAPLEALKERWALIQKERPSALAYFASDLESHFFRAKSSLPGVPLIWDAHGYPAGFASEKLGLLVLTPRELFRQAAAPGPVLRRQIASVATTRRHIESIEPGDPLVHVNHGVGRFDGLSYLDVGGVQQECLVLTYRHGDRIYVSTDRINLVFPYSALDDATVELDSLRSSRWERVRRQTRKSAEEVVEQLAALYAERSVVTGRAHPPDDDLQLEFEAGFPFLETPDQVQALKEIKADLERPQPMDRLLCGDVGFGKTEVAMRAAFAVVRGGGQVALLAPTTILAAQHLISFQARMEPFAVDVAMLSRFITAKQRKAIAKRISAGTVDVVIGTHRLLSSDIQFPNLALLIVDEEHRFGVKQKERLKEVSQGIDVLSLSATPIPRTLHFSLAGIRDISRLDTPPLERVPVMTSLHFYKAATITSAVTREIDRGGQVFFVHNRVQSIDMVYRDLTELLPGITIGVAHGQMKDRELESTMLSFAAGEFQILLCTSIIESGIDLPNVNTLIVNNAHKFGLAQLYQIRGRVGRSHRQAYTYLLVPRKPKLTRLAIRRLKTIERHSALGSGYSIAIKDLEIRGTGNLFGLEQSGHVAAVGLDLYTRIVNDVLREKELLPEQAAKESPFSSENINVRIFPDAAIPESYIADSHLRLNVYRRLASCPSLTDLAALQEELLDRFGALPEETMHLTETVAIRLLAARAGAVAVVRDGTGGVVIDFADGTDVAKLFSITAAAGTEIDFTYSFKELKNNILRLNVTRSALPPDKLLRHLFRVFID